jgi:pimeloyl-ACP methyl ester carboxylesterase
MAFIQNQGAKIYWDDRGNGPPILLIMGLGLTSDMWHRTRPLLAARYRTIALDNRGVGRSDVPPGPYSLATMASDAAAVLDAAGVSSANVFGVSMGGMIAQEFAIQYPSRVRSLTLGCTAPGGPHAVRAEPAALHMLTSRATMTVEEFSAAVLQFIHDPDTPRERIEEDLVIRRQWNPSVEGYLAQLHGIMAWEAYSRLPQITAPTLVIHGETDRLIPPGNSRVIAERIPNAKLVLIPHAGHIFTTDQPEPSHCAILDFLAAQGGASSQAQA